MTILAPLENSHDATYDWHSPPPAKGPWSLNKHRPSPLTNMHNPAPALALSGRLSRTACRSSRDSTACRSAP